ncbi:MFS transporter [Rhodoplanes sp. TEM]|uniref:MFS transporter n=1 Tax=Rhodoplanes tepidamans TaxID=200616 RepID=A0ABT5JET8_RHOTP|nr:MULTISPECIES: MFS transporter [Rhodoplanes]MDC7788147.1 MFS transporter [Rhodoplanes tepidamans]MDC7987261.1 MFS transporter [Rhodoplanes sp. TEM]MDQ0355163.1 MFS family permease [Rhodoplanes tepidamans]
MTETRLPLADATLVQARAADLRVVMAVSAAHFVSHYYILALPPVFEMVRASFAVSYTELGLALVVFNLMCAAFQTPAGILADRIGARRVLVFGLAAGGLALAGAGLVGSFWLFVVLFGLGGLANSVYHPADYAALSERVSSERIGRAYSIHTFAGMMGGAVAPPAMLLLESQIGWRGAFLASALPGLALALWLAVAGRGLLPEARHRPAAPPAAAPGGPGSVSPSVSPSGSASGSASGSVRLLTSPVILLNFVFFALFAVFQLGLQSYSAVALTAAHGLPLSAASLALTAYLLLSAIGVLLGGLPVDRVSPTLITVAGMLVVAVCTAALGLASLGTVGAVLLLGLAGLAGGMAMPARDMIVRAVTPPGAFGKVFGFVTTGFNLAGVAGPLIFGLLMDHGMPGGVFLVVAGACLLSIATVFGGRASAVPR